MWQNNNESNNWESDHSTYFAYLSLPEHLELLELRAASTADKTMLFVQYIAEENVILSVSTCSAYLA